MHKLEDKLAKVRDSCHNATRDVRALMDAVHAAVEKYKQMPDATDDASNILEHGFGMAMENASDTMMEMNGLVMFQPSDLDAQWYRPVELLKYGLEQWRFSSIVSRMSLERLEGVSVCAQAAIEGIDEAVQNLGSMIVSGEFDETAGKFRLHPGGLFAGVADPEYGFAVMPGGKGLRPIINAYEAAIAVQRAAEPVAKYIAAEYKR